MKLENMPGCCTAAILYSFGEHNEPSEVSAEKIQEFITMAARPRQSAHDEVGGKRCLFAISVDPVNIKLLKGEGFRVVDKYAGIQGMVHVMTLHD